MAGRGEAVYNGRRLRLRRRCGKGNSELVLEAKEGLALLNGTTVMTGVSSLVVDEAAYLFRLSLGAVAMTAEALGSSPTTTTRPFISPSTIPVNWQWPKC